MRKLTVGCQHYRTLEMPECALANLPSNTWGLSRLCEFFLGVQCSVDV